jgi:hypothetical protein
VPTTYAEKVASQSPASAGFGRDGGRALLPVYVKPAVLYNAITEILGSVKRGTDGRLVRGEPSSHPTFRWMLANRISNIQGVGKPVKKVAAFAGNNSAVHSYYAEYPEYLFTVEFLHQPWVSRDDSQIQVKKGVWFDGEVTAPKNTVWAEEWRRFTSHETSPGAELVTATYGFQKFRTQGATAPNGFTYPGAPKVVVGKSQLRLQWNYVPMSLIEDDKSPIIKYLGRVNQTEWKTSWATYPPGSLLYVGVEVRRYMPFMPTGKISVLGTLDLDFEYLCDVTYVFDHTNRKVEDPPATIYNSNWIPQNWNTRPWFQNRKFYYTTATDGTAADADLAGHVPTYLSALIPHHLFTDPVVL